uniref:Eukaryotic translation initiation factor 3 subunit C n=1 Tax=Phytophthora ramorum TaxID=164328 RepID=H3GBM0_PHYRM
MASRFWAGSSSSEEESDASDVSDVETSQQQQARAASRWAVQSDSDSDEEVRVVKSAKDKALENMERNCAAIRNHMKINDWTQIQSEFDELCKQLERAKKTISGLPAFYLRAMVALEDFLSEKVKNKAEQKKMSKENSKALIRMKGKIKKQFEPMRKQIDDFRANPVDSSEDESSSSESSESSESESSSSDSSASSSKSEASSDASESDDDSDDDKSGSDDDSDDSDKSWPSNSSSSSSSSSEEDDDNMPKGRARWLKQTPVVTKAKRVKAAKPAKRREAPRESDAAEKKEVVEEELKLSPSQFDRRVKEVVAMRGKKGMDLSEQLGQMRKLANYARRLGPARQIVATMYLVGTSVFDTSSKIDRVMSARHWKQVQANVSTILSLLEKNPEFSLAPLTSEDQADIDNITDADIPTQILFNRMMAQLGLCAFRCGLIWEAHACLSEICTGSRTKELLAQGLQSFRYGERDLEQERLERRRQVPYHMHINLDLMETCHLVSAMLLEVPNMVNSRLSDRKRMVSKAFRKLLEFHERLVFEGPPENPRDHVVAAAKLLAQGSWRKSAELLIGLPVWDLFPGVNVSQRVKSMVQHKIQVEALRTYLLAFSAEYDSVGLARLMEMFELDDKTVHSVVSKMMINEELQGAWDQSSQAIILYKTERSSLQTLAVQYSDKLSQIVENNERMMDLRSGTGKEEWGNRRGGGDGRRGAGGRIGFSAGGSRRGDNQGGRGGFRPRRGGGGGGGRGPRQQRQ